MADIQIGSRKKSLRRKVTIPRIDLTPMVDLGFLLIAFFMYTTTLAKPVVMELEVPRQGDKIVNGPAIPAEATLILLLTANHQIAYYRGSEQKGEGLAWCGFTGEVSLRNLLLEEKRRVTALPTTLSCEAHKLHLLIKPCDSATYDDLIRTLDEMQIGAVPYYVIMHPDDEEKLALKKFASGAYGKAMQTSL